MIENAHLHFAVCVKVCMCGVRLCGLFGEEKIDIKILCCLWTLINYSIEKWDGVFVFLDG